MEHAAIRSLAVDFTPVKSAVGSALLATKEWTLWMGHKVTAFAGLAWEAGKAALLKLAELSVLAWQACLPYIVKFGTFMMSPPGIFSMGFVLAVVILRMAVNDDNLTDSTSRKVMVVLGATMLSFTMIFGAQVGFWFVPQLAAREGLKLGRVFV